jgi:phage gp36-like protein
MAHPYTTRAIVQQTSGDPARVADLLDRNRDGAEDTVAATASIATSIAIACELVDARLGQRFSIPFASLTDTPALVTRIASMLALAHLYSLVDPESSDAKMWAASAEALLKGILDGTYYLDATQRTAATRRPVVVVAGAQFASGNTDDDYTTLGVPRLRGV